MADAPEELSGELPTYQLSVNYAVPDFRYFWFVHGDFPDWPSTFVLAMAAEFEAHG